ncbi:hypothetical protein KCU99_g1, partial [Aureobasidium melanogenum]
MAGPVLRRYPAFAILPLTAIIHAIFVVFSRIEVRLNIDFFIVCIGRTFAPFCTCCTLTSHAEVVITFDSNLHPRYPTLQAHSPELRKTWSRYAKPNNALFAPQSSLRCNESTCLLGLSTEISSSSSSYAS